MANIKIVQPTDPIDEGRIKFNDNDTNLNSDITSLQNAFNTHNHNALYYTKAEIDNIINKERFVLTLGIPAGPDGTYAKVGNLPLINGLAIPIPLDCQLLEVYALASSGVYKTWEISPPISFTYFGDFVNVKYSEQIAYNNETYAGLVIEKNGTVATSLPWFLASTGASQLRGDKIVVLSFKRV